jgi:hypothetical protein
MTACAISCSTRPVIGNGTSSVVRSLVLVSSPQAIEASPVIDMQLYLQ